MDKKRTDLQNIASYILLFLLLFQAKLAWAVPFRHLGLEEGLSSRQVYQVCKDTTGFVWAYTHVGIDRYDGNEIKHYRLPEVAESKNHILSFTIMDLDENGMLWVTQRDGKIYHYSPRIDDFFLCMDIADSIASPTLNDVEFEGGDGLWMALSSGIYYLSHGDKKILRSGLIGEWVNCFVKGEDDTYYAGTGTSVYEMKRIGSSFQLQERKIGIPVASRIESLYVHDGKLYIGTFSHGVYVVSLENETVQKLDASMEGKPIRVFVSDGNGSVLIGTDGGGVFCVDETNGTLLKHYSTNEGLEGNTVSDIHVDEDGGIWISTTTNGLCFLNPNLLNVRRYKHERGNPASLVSDHVNVMIEDSNGDYWFGTNDGISYYQEKTKQWKHFLTGGGQTSVVLALCEDKDGNIWAGGYGIGLHCIQKHTGNVIKMPVWNAQTGSGVSTNYIYSICAVGDDLWVGGIEGQMFRYNRRTRKYTYYPIDCLADIKKGADNTLFIAACGGLGIFDMETGNVEWRTKFGDRTLRYPIRCLLQSSNEDLWLLTDGDGLIRVNLKNDSTRIYTTEDGLVSNSVNSIVEDSHGNIWFNTEKELYCLDLTDDLVINGNELLDVGWGAYNANAALKTQDGRLAFGTAEGILSFVPSFDFSQEVQAKLILTELKLPYETVKVGVPNSPLKQSINETDKLKLSYRQNSFSIGFSAINILSSHRVRYEYRLKNCEEQWHRVDEVGTVSYMDIPSGVYKFQIRAVDKYTGKLVDERALEIVIAPPFWASWWAILIYIVLSVVSVRMLILYFRQKAREEKNREKINSFIGLAHDIRTPVTLIKAPLSELDALEDLPEEAKKKLGVAVKNVDKLFDMITQLMDLEKTEMTHEELRIAQYDIKAYLEEKMEEFRLPSMQKGVEMQLKVEPDMPEVWIDREKLDHIMDNLLSNALKYTVKGTISMHVSFDKKSWSIAIQDTGIGIPQEEQSHIFHEYFRAKNTMGLQESGTGIGLIITRRLVKQHQGEITFSSVEGKGTTFLLTFPYKLKADVVIEKKEEGELEQKSSKRRATSKKKSGKTLLLLAEDDADMRDYLTESLSTEYKIVAVPDGGKALELAREMNPDIIISDVVMPVLEGDELCRILKSSVETSHIPVVLLTALSERENIIFGLEAGANDYIIKPFDLAVLKIRLRNILNNRQRFREAVLTDYVKSTAEMGNEYTNELDKKFMDKMLAAVNQEIANPELSITELCRIVGMSRTSIYNKLKSLVELSPNDFIRVVRLNKSRELLESHQYNISEVSTMCGFADPKYFSTCFKKQFGISPSKLYEKPDPPTASNYTPNLEEKPQ